MQLSREGLRLCREGEQIAVSLFVHSKMQR